MAAPPSADPLLQPLQIKGLRLKNRVMSTSHACRLTEDELPQLAYQRYHEEKAKGGLALTMFGGSSNVSVDSPNTFGQISLRTDEVVPHLRAFSDRIHAHGAALMCQITHLGRRGDAYASPWLPMVAPSVKRETLHRAIPQAMTTHDIARVVRDFGQAARRCKAGGLDGLETHAGGHLIGQFLDPTVNLRSDRYGGTIANRCRFAIEVHEEIRRQVGDDFVVGLRLALADGCSFDDSVAMARTLQATGLFDFFNVVYGRMDTALALAVYSMPAMFMPSAPWLSRAAAFKRAVQLPVFHASKIADFATARYAIAEGLIDMVGMTRAHIAEPRLVRLIEEHRESEARPCVGASFCRSHNATCLHNPATARETVLSHDIAPAQQPRNVLIVGAGPAGLEAARVCGLRGHRVTVWEAAPHPGGQIRLAAGGNNPQSWRRDLIGVVDWRVSELQRLRVPVLCNRYTEIDDVLAHEADVVILATGGVPNLADLPGSAHCLSVFDALTGPVPAAGSVLIYDGTGRHNAWLCAERFVAAGRDVTLAIIDAVPAQEAGGRGDDVAWQRRLAQWQTPIHNHLELLTVEPAVAGSAPKQAVFKHLLTEEEVRLAADHIVVERGTVAADELFDAARAYSCNDGVIDLAAFARGQAQPCMTQPTTQPAQPGFALYRIGDAWASRDIHSAVYDAYRLCCAL